MKNASEMNTHEWQALQRRVEQVDARFKLIMSGAVLAGLAAAVMWARVASSEPTTPVLQEYPDLYHFEANTPALAVEVNSNFSTLHGLIDGSAQAIAGNIQAISNLQDSKLDKSGGTVTGNLDVNGQIEVGHRLESCTYAPGSTYSDCSCDSNEHVLGGGAYGGGGHSLRESRPVTTRTWRVACIDQNGARRDCQGFNILCARLH